jgi:hypothetical protein
VDDISGVKETVGWAERPSSGFEIIDLYSSDGVWRPSHYGTLGVWKEPPPLKGIAPNGGRRTTRSVACLGGTLQSIAAAFLEREGEAAP